MSWHRLDVGYFSNPKVRRLSARAKCLDIAGIAYCNRELTDGVIANERLPIVLAEACATRAQLRELIVKDRWTQSASEVGIHHFKSSNPSADKVLKARAKHSELIKRLRRGTRDQVTDQVTDPISDAQAEGHRGKGANGNKAAIGNGAVPAADFEEVVMPTQDAMATIARAWQDVTGKDPTHSDVGFFAHWLDQYQLSDSQVIQEMRRVTARQGDKGEPVKTAKYLDQVMRELGEHKPPRSPGIVHEFGPLQLVAPPRGVDANGNPEPPEDLAS
jgi:hypothetical protein